VNANTGSEVPGLSGLRSGENTTQGNLYAETVEQAPVAISITDDKANIQYVNKAFTETTGYASQEIIGCNESILSDRQTPAAVYQSLWNTILAKKTWNGCLINRHKDGTRYLAELTIAPIVDAEEKITHYIGMHRDITEEHNLEQQVTNQKKMIETVFDSIPVAAVLLNASLASVLANRMYHTLAHELESADPSKLFIEILKKELAAGWDKLQLSCTGFKNHEVRIDLGGHLPARWFECSGNWFAHHNTIDAFFGEPGENYLLLTLNDITRQRKHEETIRINAMRALIAEEEKTRSVREAIQGAIHHIHGPLNQLNAARTLLNRRADAPENQALLDIFDQIILAEQHSIAQLESCMPTSINHADAKLNINQLLHETIVVLTDRLLASGIVVEWKPAATLPMLIGKENPLRSAFKYLVENAIDAMNEAATVKRELKITTRADSNMIYITIEDTGPGLSPDLYLRAFEPFFTTRKNDKRGRHSGMGLAMAQEIINQHLGIIQFDPDYHEGCRVKLQFSLTPPGQQQQGVFNHG
jgi:nitrogen fixation negative regulator NifL